MRPFPFIFMADNAGGDRGPEHFETNYIFTIDQVTLDIKIADPYTGDFISVNEYMQRNLELR